MPRILSSDSQEIPFRKRSVKGVDLFVVASSVEVIAEEADGSAALDRETMGLMIGRIYKDDEGAYAVMHRTVTSDLVADATHVRFDPESMEELIDGVDAMADDERIIGWYHSHLDYGVFMSETDVRTQHSLFGEGMGFALVIDPLRGEFAVFDNSETPQKVRMIIME